jgi:mannosyltransferase
MHLKSLRSPIGIALGLFALNLLVKGLFVQGNDFAQDEPFSVFHAQQDVPHIWTFFTSTGENNPPLYTLLLHFWIGVAGDSPLGARSLSVLLSALTAVVIYFVGRKLGKPGTGLIATLLYTFSTQNIFFAHESRSYPLLCLFAALALLAYVGLAQEPRGWKWYVLLAVSDVLLLYTHYFGGILILMQVITLPFLREWKRIFLRLALAGLAVELGYLPLLLQAVSRLGTSAAKGTWVLPPGMGEIYGFINLFLNSKWVTVALLLVAAGGLVMMARKRLLGERLKAALQEQEARVLALWFGVPYVGMFVLSITSTPIFMDRYLLFLTPSFYLLVAWALTWMWQGNRLQPYAVGAFLGIFIVSTELNPSSERELAAAVADVKRLKTDDTLVLICPDYARWGFGYHYNREWFRDYAHYDERLYAHNFRCVNNLGQMEEAMATQPARCLLYQAGYEAVDPGNAMLKALIARYAHVDSIKHPKIFNLYLFH